jgi:hypothetical protein
VPQGGTSEPTVGNEVSGLLLHLPAEDTPKAFDGGPGPGEPAASTNTAPDELTEEGAGAVEHMRAYLGQLERLSDSAPRKEARGIDFRD